MSHRLIITESEATQSVVQSDQIFSICFDSIVLICPKVGPNFSMTCQINADHLSPPPYANSPAGLILHLIRRAIRCQLKAGVPLSDCRWFNRMKFAPIIFLRSFRSHCPTVGPNFTLAIENYLRSSDQSLTWQTTTNYLRLLFSSDASSPTARWDAGFTGTYLESSSKHGP